MPRRNAHLLVLIVAASLLCYWQNHSQYRRMFVTMANVMEQVETSYVDPVDRRQLFEGALQGIVSRLDPYSSYIGPREYKEFLEGVDQQFGGVGIDVSADPETGRLTVVSPLVGTPAYQAGILAGDVILKIDGASTNGFSLEDAVRRLRGMPGHPVRLTILHAGEMNAVDLELTRAVIHVDTVLGDTRAADGRWNFLLASEPKIGFVRVASFGNETVRELKDALATLAELRVQGLVLDLRNNPGGLLKAATETCDLLLDRGRIVSIQGRGGVELETFDASGDGAYRSLPLVVLVNQFSASASEIVAACLQDHHRAIVVGQRSWGKGTVQSMIPLESDTAALKLTTAYYLRPSKRNIHRRRDTDGEPASPNEEWGVKPDPGYEVPLTEEELRKWITARRQRDAVRSDPNKPPTEDKPESPVADPQLDKAVKYLRQKLSRPAVPAQAA